MCKAFSCIVTDQGEVRWKMAVDSHSELLKEFGITDRNTDRKEIRFAKVEITPDNGDYANPDKWTLRIDEAVKPDWWEVGCEKDAFKAQRKWYAQVKKMMVRKPIVHPFKKKPPRITEKHIALLKEWDSVCDSVRDSVWASVRASVWDSVGDSVWDSVRASVWDSVGASVGASVRASVGASVGDSVSAYMGSRLKLSRKAWKYTENINCKGYPFQSCVDLWKSGLVPSYDGKKWRLHGGKDAKILWEGEI